MMPKSRDEHGSQEQQRTALVTQASPSLKGRRVEEWRPFGEEKHPSKEIGTLILQLAGNHLTIRNRYWWLSFFPTSSKTKDSKFLFLLLSILSKCRRLSHMSEPSKKLNPVIFPRHSIMLPLLCMFSTLVPNASFRSEQFLFSTCELWQLKRSFHKNSNTKDPEYHSS